MYKLLDTDYPEHYSLEFINSSDLAEELVRELSKVVELPGSHPEELPIEELIEMTERHCRLTVEKI